MFKFLPIAYVCLFVLFVGQTLANPENFESQLAETLETEEKIFSSSPLRDAVWYEQQVTSLARQTPIEAVNLAENALVYFKSNPESPSHAVVLNELSTALYFLARFSEAMKHAKSAEIIAKKYHLEKSLARSYTRQGNVLQYLGQYERAINLYNQALVYYRANKMDSLRGRTLNSVANTYLAARQHQSALDFYYQYQDVAMTDYDRALAALGIANTVGELGRIDESVEYFNKAILLSKENDQIVWEMATNGLARNLLALNQPQKALELVNKAIDSAKKGNRLFRQISFLQAKSEAFIAIGDFKSALDETEEALSIANSIGDKKSLAYIYETQTKIFEQTQQFEKALKASKSAEIYRSEYVNEQIASKLAAMQAILETDAKDYQIGILSAENKVQQLEIEQQKVTMIAIIGSTLFLATVLISFLYRKNQIRLLNEQKNISRRLEELNELKNQLLANTSHELRTPLNGILGMTQLLQLEQMSEESTEQVVIIEKCSKRLLSLIEDILDLTQLQAHHMRLRSENFALSPVVKEVCRLLESLSSKKGLKVEVCIDPEEVKVFADKKRVHQIFNNLIGNAIKFSQQGCIRISAQIKDEILEIRVKDEGEGIPKENQKMIFEPFAQVDSTSRRVHEGSGLGLAITKELLLLHGSQIEVFSDLNQGAEFCFHLPLAKLENKATG